MIFISASLSLGVEGAAKQVKPESIFLIISRCAGSSLPIKSVPIFSSASAIKVWFVYAQTLCALSRAASSEKP